LRKEAAYYKTEVLENEQIVQKMKNNQADPYDVKRYQQVLNESYMMVPDSEKRFATSMADLQEFLETPGLDPVGEWYGGAVDLLQEQAALEQTTAKEAEHEHEPHATNVDNLALGEAF
jgi:tubulin-specific chaperone A